MIALENVVKSYPNGVGAINGISLHIKRGEFVFIVGDTGSGKSTLIKLLLKALEPTEGRVRANGVNLARMRKRMIPKYRRKIGCVFQDFRLLKDRNVHENVCAVSAVEFAADSQILCNARFLLVNRLCNLCCRLKIDNNRLCRRRKLHRRKIYAQALSYHRALFTHWVDIREKMNGNIRLVCDPLAQDLDRLPGKFRELV